MKSSIILVLLVFSLNSFGQGIAPTFELELERYKPTRDYIIESYITPDGSRSVVLTPSKFYLIDNESGEYLITRDLFPKTKESVETVQTADVVNEGSAFLVIPESQSVAILDWSLVKNEIEVYNLKDGTTRWESDKYRFTNTGEELAEKVAANAAVDMLTSNSSLSAEQEEFRLVQEYLVSNPTGPAMSSKARKLVTPVGSEGILIHTSEGQVMLNTTEGKELWEFTEFPLVVGSYYYLPDRKEIALVNENDYITGGNANRRTLVMLNTKTGKKRFEYELLDPNTSDYIREEEGLLIFDLFNFTAIDIETGEGVVRTRVKKENSGGNPLGGPSTALGYQTPTAALNSLVNYPEVYTGYLKLSGGLTATASRSFGSKTTIARYDLETGEQVWEREELTDAVDAIPYVNDQHLIVARKGMGKQEWYVLDKENGETQEVITADKGPSLWHGGKVVLAGKKELQVFDVSSLDKPTSSISYKSMEVGKVEELMMHEGHIVGVAKEGVVFMDGQGKIIEQITTDKVDDFVLTEKYLALIAGKAILLVDMNDMKIAGSVPFSLNRKKDVFMISQQDGTMLTVEDHEEVTGYQLK